VVPTGNVDPEAGVQVGVTCPLTASVAVTVYVTTAPCGLVACAGEGLLTTVITGGVVSGGGVTVTVNVCDALFPAASVATHVT